MPQDKVLIVDDDIHILRMASRILQSDGILTTEVSSGREALNQILYSHYDLILLDINLDDLDGFSIVKKVRAQGIKTPIIIISGNTEEYNTIFGLGIGADDYLTKPVSPAILGAKVKALIRRNRTAMELSEKVLERGPFSFDLETYSLYMEGREIPLTSKEKQLVCLFLKNINTVFTKEMLFEQVWKDRAVDDNTIMVNIRNIRAKIEPDPKNPRYLKTVWGMGYQFVLPPREGDGGRIQSGNSL